MDKVVAAPIRLQFCNTVETSINIDDFLGWMSSGGGGRPSSPNPQQGEFVTKLVCSKIIRIRAPLGRTVRAAKITRLTWASTSTMM